MNMFLLALGADNKCHTVYDDNAGRTGTSENGFPGLRT